MPAKPFYPQWLVTNFPHQEARRFILNPKFALHYVIILNQNKMTSKILETIQETLGTTLIHQGSPLLGESPENISSSLKTIFPVILGAIALKGNTEEGAGNLLRYLEDHQIDGKVLSNLAAPFSGAIETEKFMYNGAGILRNLVGDNLKGIVEHVSKENGISLSSATSLLKLAAPFIMGIISKHITDHKLDATSLSAELKTQLTNLKPGFSAPMAQLLGTNAPSTNGISKDDTNPFTITKLLPWIILILVSLALFYFIQNGCNKKEEVELVPEPAKDTVAIKAPVDPQKQYILPDNTTIKAIPGTFTANLLDFLSSAEKGKTCLAFDKVSFENNSFKLTKSSDPQLQQLVKILSAYADVKIDLEGHTDDAGDDGKNKNLSKERAKVIKTWLTDQGIAQNRINIKGWGEEKPVASNDTEKGRNQNRRVEVCVNKK